MNKIKNALIISLKFHPGHFSHLLASYRQMEDLRYNPILWIHKNSSSFINRELNIITNRGSLPRTIDIALFLFPNPKNILEILYLKIFRKSCVVYFFHEPLTKISTYRKAGFSLLNIFKLYIGLFIDAIVVKISDVIILPSNKAYQYYLENRFYTNNKIHYMPLMYDEEDITLIETKKRLYFSYIGTIAPDHSFQEYLDFISDAIKYEKIPNVKFLIATKSEFKASPELINSSRVIIQQGRALSDLEINTFYAETIVVWNAYIRTTQSGVLAKSFMFGTPAIIMSHNLNEFTVTNQNVIAIEDNKNYRQIEKAIIEISDNFVYYSLNCRSTFKKKFYYKNYNRMFKNVLNNI